MTLLRTRPVPRRVTGLSQKTTAEDTTTMSTATESRGSFSSGRQPRSLLRSVRILVGPACFSVTHEGFIGPGLATLRLDFDGGGAGDDDDSDDVVRREMQQETIDWDDRTVEFAKDRRGLSEVTDWVTVEATGDGGEPARRSGTRHQGGRDACGTMASQKDSGGIGGWLVGGLVRGFGRMLCALVIAMRRK